MPLLAADKRQAKQALDYVRGLARMPTFAPYVARELTHAIELTTACTLEVKAASYRLVRGFSVPSIVADELAFWWQGAESANADTEVIAALLPAMATMPHAQLWGLSTPYSKSGALFDAYASYYGVEGAEVLVWQAPSLDMNSTLDAKLIERALEQDPERASAEYLAQFRVDVANFLSAEAYDAAVNRSRPLELPPRTGLSYAAFADPSGGSNDSFTVAIGHLENGVTVLDLVREAPAPFNPDTVTEQFAGLLRGYGIQQVTGDRYSAEWVASSFAKRGIVYQVSERSRSQLYLEFLGPLNSGRISLPPHTKLRAQFLGLERRTTRSGQGSVDHRVAGHDDLCNATAGVCVLIGGGAAPWDNWIEFVKSEAIRGGGPLPASATPADYARRGGTVETVLEPPPDAPSPPAPTTSHLGALHAVTNAAPPVNTLHHCAQCGHPTIGSTPTTCPNCGLAP